jgi:acetyl esterase/lipase
MVKHSKRFASSKELLCERVSQAGFRGYWVTKSQDRTNIITVLWIHGGGYIQGHPLANAAQCLRIAEVARQHHDCAVDIFALEYDLTPEAVFPTQINQAVAAYRYLITEPTVNPENLVLMGSSAGGHLALSLLYELSIAGIARPGKAVLLYPWVNLNNSGPSVVANKDKDSLDKSTLDKIVSQLLGPGGRDRFSHLVDFAAPLQRTKSNISWNEILPAKTWITVGGNDIFHSDIAKFTSLARADGSFIELDIVPDVPHGWLEYQDLGESERYLDTAASEDFSLLMPGAEALANKICE